MNIDCVKYETVATRRERQSIIFIYKGVFDTGRVVLKA